MFRADVNTHEVGPGAQSAALFVSVPAQPMYTGPLLACVEAAYLPADSIMQSRTHARSCCSLSGGLVSPLIGEEVSIVSTSAKSSVLGVLGRAWLRTCCRV